MFAPVCHSVHGGGVVSVQGRLCQGDPYPPTLKSGRYAFLLECILVSYCFDYPIDIAIS